MKKLSPTFDSASKIFAWLKSKLADFFCTKFPHMTVFIRFISKSLLTTITFERHFYCYSNIKFFHHTLSIWIKFCIIFALFVTILKHILFIVHLSDHTVIRSGNKVNLSDHKIHLSGHKVHLIVHKVIWPTIFIQGFLLNPFFVLTNLNGLTGETRYPKNTQSVIRVGRNSDWHPFSCWYSTYRM